MDLFVATRNSGKLIELRDILRPLNINVRTYDEFPHIKPVAETGTTFEQNAVLKASQTAKQTNLITLADDSGLEVDCLAGQPGVYSARFAGQNATDSMNNEKLLDLMDGVPLGSRQARFVCAIAIASPDKVIGTVTGVCEGHIALEPDGSGGFGYDPLFVASGYNYTFAQLSSEIKNKISHRGKALNKAFILLEKLVLSEPG